MAKFKLPPESVVEVPVPITDEEHYALKALEQGKAIPGQQQTALKCIVEKFSAYYEMSMRCGVSGDRETAFNEGRRFVGAQIIAELKTVRKPKPAPVVPPPRRPRTQR